MSTDLYNVRVLSVERDRLTCRVTAFDPRSEDDPPPSRTLALQFLWEPWERFSHGFFFSVAGGPGTSEQAEELGRAAPIGPELAGQDICDGDWIRANVNRFIRDVQVRDRGWICLDDCAGEENGYGAIAVCTITVTDPRWVEHLRPGMEWGTTAYDRDDQD
ncbi:MAG: hypothetical protein ACREP9_13230 [Candidatus Dormibacteraceae bacterium]